MLTCFRSCSVDTLLVVAATGAAAAAGGFVSAEARSAPNAASAVNKARFAITDFVFIFFSSPSPLRVSRSVSAPTYANAISQLRLGARRERHVERERARVLLGRWQARRHDFPIAAGRLVNQHALRRILVIAQLDLPSAFVHARADGLPSRLRAVSHDVEGFAKLDPDAFVARRVLNRVLADELLLTAFVCFVDAHRALGQRHTQVVRHLVLEVQIHADLLARRDLPVIAAEVLLRAEEDQLLLQRDAGGLEQADLLLL